MKTLILSLAGSPLSPRALVERTEPPEGGELPLLAVFKARWAGDMALGIRVLKCRIGKAAGLFIVLEEALVSLL